MLFRSLTGNYVEVLFEGPDEWMRHFQTIRVTDVTPDRTLGEVAA